MWHYRGFRSTFAIIYSFPKKYIFNQMLLCYPFRIGKPDIIRMK